MASDNFNGPVKGISTVRDVALPVDQVLRMAIASQADWSERDAIPAVAAALARAPEDARLHQMMGALERSLDETERALGHFERALALDPENARLAYAVAQTRLDGGLDATEAFERALALAPGDRQYRLGMAAALLAGGGTREADARLSHWLSEDPTWAQGHAALVRLRFQAGEDQAAWRTLAPAAIANPGEIDLWRELISGLMHAKKFEGALAVVAQGRHLHGNDIMFASSEAGCLDEMGQTEAAERTFLSVGRVADAGLALRFARHLLRAHRPEDAAAVAEGWLGQPSERHFWPYIATAWRITGNPRWQWLEGDERFVGTYDLSDRIASIDGLAVHLRDLHRTVHQPLEQSLRSGTQTNGRLFARIDPVIRQLRNAIVDAVTEHRAQLPPPDPTHPTLRDIPPQVRFSGSWSVRLTGSGHHAVHMHPEGWLSSAFYVALPESMANADSEEGLLTFGGQPEFADCPPPFRTVRPSPGKLALFPSTLWHGTTPISGGERLTVAFDVAPSPPALLNRSPAER